MLQRQPDQSGGQVKGFEQVEKAVYYLNSSNVKSRHQLYEHAKFITIVSFHKNSLSACSPQWWAMPLSIIHQVAGKTKNKGKTVTLRFVWPLAASFTSLITSVQLRHTN